MKLNVIILCGLCALAFILSVEYSTKKNELKTAREVLVKDAVTEYLKESKKRNTDFYRSAKRHFPRNNLYLIELYSNEFSCFIDELLESIPSDQLLDDEGFFETRIAIDRQTQLDLWQAQRNLVSIIETDLDAKTEAETEFFTKARVEAEQHLKEIVTASDHAAIGRQLSFWYSFALMDTTLSLPVTIKREKAGRRGDERYNLIASYLKLLDYDLASPKKQKVRAIVREIKDAFFKDGFIKVHTSEYDLSSVAPAELISLCKYISFLDADLNRHFIDDVVGRIP